MFEHDWLNLQNEAIAGPEAWTPARIWIPAALHDWDMWHVWLGSMQLPLSLNRSQGQHRVVVEWPASEPGFHRVRWQHAHTSGESWVFVGLRHLNPEDWVALLEDLAWQLPRQLYTAQLHRRAQIPLQPQPEIASTAVTAVHQIQQLWPQILAVLKHSRTSAPGMLQSTWGFVSMTQSKRLSSATLYRDPRQLSPRTALWQQHLLASESQAEMQLLAATLQYIARLLTHLLHLLLRLGEVKLWHELNRLQACFKRDWRQHPLASLSCQMPARQNWQGIYAQAWALYQALSSGLLPHLTGQIWSPSAPFAGLYQHWCGLQLASFLRTWAVQQEAQIIQASHWQAGKTFLSVRLGAEHWQFIPEAHYRSQGLWHSLSHAQRPDFSVRYHCAGQRPRLLIWDAKFRQGPQGPLKADLDKLHAYRDAIRYQNKLSIVSAHILYPGPYRNYQGGVSAWSAKPGKLEWLSLLEQSMELCRVAA